MEAKVTVFSDRFYPGFNGKEAELYDLPYGRTMTLTEALETRWDTDAHVALYSIPGEDECPRLNKPALAFFQTNPNTTIPELGAVMIDVDLPGHGKTYDWTNRDEWPSATRQWMSNVNACMQRIPELQTAGTYLTRGGLRFVWPLPELRRIGVQLADSYIAQFHRYLEGEGLPVDSSCSTWNHLFRLPFVRRDGVAQRLPFDTSSMRPSQWSPPKALTDTGPAAIGKAATTDMPDPDELGKPPKASYKFLRGKTPYYQTLVHGFPIADEGERHDTVMGLCAQIVDLKDTNDPIEPFRLLLPSAQAAGFPVDELWSQCVWVCRVHDGGRKLRSKHRTTVRDEAAGAMGIDAGKVSEHLILATRMNSNYYVFDEHKMSWGKPVNSQSLILTGLRDCPALADIHPKMATNEILQKHSTLVNHVVISYERTKVEFDPMMGTVYEPGAPIDPRHKPMFDETIDGWLRLLFGDEPERGLDWLATLLVLNRPTCALYIRGDADIGKGLFAAGLSKIWNSAPSKYEELIRNFQDGLSQCPLIWADEKVPENPFTENDSSVFRKVIGTGRQKIFRKNKPPADLEGFPRVLITANNPDALRIRESLDAADVKAIQQRIGYVDAGEAPGHYLKARAHARGLTVADMADEWIDGGGLAGHVLWLHKNREVERGDRFLVEGWSSDLTDRLSMKFGAAPAVGKFIARVLRDKKRNIKAVRWADGKVWANVDYMRDAWAQIMGKSSYPPPDQVLMQSLKALSDDTSKRIRPTSVDNPRYYWGIPFDRIVRIAEEFYVCDRETLETVTHEREISQDEDATTETTGAPIFDMMELLGMKEEVSSE